MSTEAQLATLVRQYLASKTSFNELAAWVQDEDEFWQTLPRTSPSRDLASLIMLMAYEVWAGDRYEATAREVIRKESASLVGA